MALEILIFRNDSFVNGVRSVGSSGAVDFLPPSSVFPPSKFYSLFTMVGGRCSDLLKSLVLLLLIAAVVGQRPRSVVASSVPLLKSQVNLLHFAPGRLTSDGLAGIDQRTSYRYTFENLPEWIDFDGSKLVAVPPANQTGTATIKVKYDSLKGAESGSASVTLSYGEGSSGDGNLVVYFVGALGFKDALKKSTEGGEFVILIPLQTNQNTEEAT